MLDYLIPLVLLAAVLFCFLPQRMIDMGKTWCENLIKDTEEDEDDIVLYEDPDDSCSSSTEEDEDDIEDPDDSCSSFRRACMYNVNLTT